MRGVSSDPTCTVRPGLQRRCFPNTELPPNPRSHCYYTMAPSARSYLRGPCCLPVTVRLESVTLPLHLSAGQPWPSPILVYQQCRVTDGHHPIQDYRGLFERPKMTAPPWASFGSKERALAPLRRCSTLIAPERLVPVAISKVGSAYKFKICNI